MSSDHITEAPIKGRPPTTEEENLIEWGRETHRRSLRSVQESLRSMVSLTSALLAGSTAFFTQLPGLVGFKAFGVVLLMVSLIAAVRGSLPIQRTFNLDFIEDIRKARDTVESSKSLCLYASCLSLLAGFASFIAGALILAFRGTPQ